jgi:hypothetical protein
MRLECHLRQRRGELSLRDLVHAAERIDPDAGLSSGVLSLIERGRLLPTDRQVVEKVYSTKRHEWYPPHGLAALERDEPKERR